MPTISPFAQKLVLDARLTSADVLSLKTAVENGQATASDVEVLATRYANAFDAGAGAALRQLATDLGRRIEVDQPMANLSAAPGLLNGLVVISETQNKKHAFVPLLQKALMALASRTPDRELMLPKYGADGDFGGETMAALRAFQQKNGLPETGLPDLATAQKLDEKLRGTRIPPIFAGQTDLSGGALMAKAAVDLVQLKPDAYGVDDPWRNHDPRHAITAVYGRRLGAPVDSLKGKWKCNLFACGVLAAAGFEPPYYRAPGKPTNQGEYPNANQLYKWSDKYAGANNNRGFERFELRGELAASAVTDPAEREAAITALLKKVEPGDMLIVDHMGGDVADGGHCRVATKVHGDGTCDFAQASFERAEIQTENFRDLMGEEHIWILRPNKKRPEGATAIV